MFDDPTVIFPCALRFLGVPFNVNRLEANLLDFMEGSSGPEGVRTPDLMTASHARSQLRHRPDEH
jgi:hypothetical protein